MSYSVLNLITNAYYVASIVGRDFQTLSGSQLSTGLEVLNDILADKVIETDMVPYWTTQFQFPATVNQEKYFIPNLIRVETLVFFINTVRYNTSEVPRDRYFGSARAENIQSLPFTWHQERTLGGVNIFLYFFPQQNYTMEISGLFRLYDVTLNQQLDLTETVANLGTATVTGTGNFGAGQLVINGIDLQGTYATVAALVAFINTGIIPNISAALIGTEVHLIAAAPRFSIGSHNINITTLGTEGNVNNVNFSNFSTTTGPNNVTFFPQGLERFYINYLKYALAVRLCKEFNYTIPEGADKQLLAYEELITKRSAPMDLTNATITTLTDEAGYISYGQVNIGRGWTTAGY
jgi:hypothetical protein